VKKNRNRYIKIQTFILVILIFKFSFLGIINNVNAALYLKNGDTIPSSKIEYTADDTEFTYFPESYRANLKVLKANHPNWIFMAVYTNLDWYQSVAHESYEKGKVNYISTVPASYSSVWKKDGVNNYVNGDSRWVIASKSAVAHCLDPRNWLTDSHIFQFEVLDWTELGKSSVDAAMKYLLPNMYATTTFVNTLGQTVPLGKSYTDIIYEAGKESDINPISIIAKIKQEVGDFGSDGSKNSSVSGTVSGYVGYYNFFNVNATDGADAITKGLIYAKNQGWDTPEKSIKAGAATLYNGYIKYGQNTLYNQKFDVTNIYGNASCLYSTQYMTNILDPRTQAQNIYNSYNNMGIVNSNFVFYIPVFDNMPALASPLNDTSSITYTEDTSDIKVKVINCSSLTVRNGISTDNSAITSVTSGTIMTRLAVYSNKWSKVKLADGTIGYVFNDYIEVVDDSKKVAATGISLDKSSYDVEIGNKVVYTANVLPSDATNKGYTVTAKDAGIVNIDGVNITGKSVGSTTLTFTTVDGGFTCNAIVNVKEQTKKYEINTSKLAIENNNIKNIGFNKKLSEIKSAITLYNSSRLVVKNIDGNVLADDSNVGTGTTFTIYDYSGNVVNTYTAIIKGDATGDGRATAADYVQVKNNIMGTFNMTGIQKLGADANGDSKVSAADYVVIKNYIMGVGNI
jgi:beta-N-acetylglucosaminidase